MLSEENSASGTEEECKDNENRKDDSNGNGFRIKLVAEINGEVDSSTSVQAENADSSGTKRRLPEWMLTQTSSRTDEPADTEAVASTSKRLKVDEDESLPVVKSEPANNETIETSTEAAALPAIAQAAKTISAQNDSTEQPQTSSGTGSTSIPNDIKPAIKVEKADASSTSREMCKFGIRCYRRNPMHRIEEAHPGDHDYKRPSFPPPPSGTPDCPFGNLCYRRNPVHFQQYNHPPDTDFKQNYKNHSMRLRQRRQQNTSTNANTLPHDGNSSELDDYDLDDPFIDDDDDAEYMPSSDDDIDELDYDDCDKAEE